MLYLQYIHIVSACSHAILWSLLILLFLTIRVSAVTCVTSSSLLINNSVTADKLGTMNGLGVVVISAGRYVIKVQITANVHVQSK